MNQALILIDIQNDYFPGGAMEVPGSEAAAQQAARLLGAFRQAQLPVIHIQHLSVRPGATFFLPGTRGAEIYASVQPAPGEKVFTKNFPNSFRDTPLLEELKQLGAERLTIAGMMSQMCIDATTRAAFDLGFKCRVASDACAARPLSFEGETVPARQVHCAYMSALGAVYAQILPAKDVVGSITRA